MSERKLPVTFHGGYQISAGEYQPDSAPRSDFGAELIENRFTLGADIPMYHDPKFRGSLAVELFGGNDSIDYSSWGSRRFQFGLGLGWRQDLYNVLWGQAEAKMGINLNYINDGGGEQPEQEVNASISTQFKLGAKLCFGRSSLCLEPYVGMGFERSLGGSGYSIVQHMVGVQFGGHGDSVDEAEYDQLVEDKRRREAVFEKQIRQLETEKQRLERELDQVLAASKHIYKRSGVLSYVFKIPKDLADKELDFTKSTDSTDSIVQELVDQVISPNLNEDNYIYLHGLSSFMHGNRGDNQVACFRFIMAVKKLLISKGIPPERVLFDAHLRNTWQRSEKQDWWIVILMDLYAAITFYDLNLFRKS